MKSLRKEPNVSIHIARWSHFARLSFVVIVLYGVWGCNSSSAQRRDISIEDAAKLITQPNTFLLDVRTPAEFADAHIEGAHLIPVDELEARIRELQGEEEKEVVVYCRSGSRSSKAADLLAKNGFKVANVEGGINAWTDSGKPVKTGAE